MSIGNTRFDVAPSLAEEQPSDRQRSFSDLVKIVFGVAVFFVLSIEFEVAERLNNWTYIYEHWQLDEIPLTLLALSIGLVWFGWRRWRELDREIQIRRLVEESNRAALAQNRRLAQQLIQLQESERRYIARELHDEFGQCCVAIKVDAALIALESKNRQPTIYASAQLISDAADHLHQVLRGMLNRLRPSGLDDLGLVSSLQLLVEDWQARHGIACTFASNCAFDTLEETSTIALYRSVQEGLTNIAKHAQASEAVVTITNEAQHVGPDLIVLSVVDNGVGLKHSADLTGFGILGMRERVGALGGQLSLSTRSSGGTQLRVVLPMVDAETAI